MRVLIIGAAGMVGRKLAERIARDGSVAGRAVTALDLYDVVEPTPPATTASVRCLSGDLAAAGEAKRLVAAAPDLIFHLAAIVSGEAEQNLDKGYAVNVTGTWNLFEEVRTQNAASSGRYCPRLVFTSSTGVFGAPFPEAIGDDFIPAPLTSYGAQKAMGELLLADYTRKGFFDGIGIRLPTICVRPGKPNKAASGFFSSIIREPLVGQTAILPVSEDVRHWHASPRSGVGFLLHAATIDGSAVGPRRTITMPGVSCTVAEQIDALRRIAGESVAGLIRREPDEQITKIVSGWPRRFDPARALSLGFKAETSFDEIVRIHIEDELGGRIGS
ncbi:MAG: SDR family oxidoreductase [Burkholderiales bacterium]|nr:SDR family oxidoreductase [Burkholderiales bacterium]